MVTGKDKKLRGREKELSRINRKLFPVITQKDFRKNKDFGKEAAFPDHSWASRDRSKRKRFLRGGSRKVPFLKRKYQSAHGWE